MPAPVTIGEFLEIVRKSGIVEEKDLNVFLEKMRAAPEVPVQPAELASALVREGLLTNFQSEQLLRGKYRRFSLGKYKILERLGSGGLGNVYLGEHRGRRRLVAIKVLATVHAQDPSALKRFQREAQAIGALDHPNIVRFYDLHQDGDLNFLVMQYIDGSSLQEIIKIRGPMDILRVSHYIRQAARGLQHIHEAGLVHRDIKPSNLLVDRDGTVKVLDMGLVLFSLSNSESEVITKTTLGTADFIAPEQALDSHDVDIRADIFSLGATFSYLLTGQARSGPDGKFQPLRTLRPEAPAELAGIIEKMMAPDRERRFRTPHEVFEALTPWTRTPIPPPSEDEMPQFSPAAKGLSI